MWIVFVTNSEHTDENTAIFHQCLLCSLPKFGHYIDVSARLCLTHGDDSYKSLDVYEIFMVIIILCQ